MKELIQKSLEINQIFNWVQNLDKLIENINNSNHRIDSARDKELKIQKKSISKEGYEIGDIVRLHQPSDKTRQVWSNEIYKIERVYKPKKPYRVYEYKVDSLKDRLKEEELVKLLEIHRI